MADLEAALTAEKAKVAALKTLLAVAQGHWEREGESLADETCCVVQRSGYVRADPARGMGTRACRIECWLDATRDTPRHVRGVF